MTTGIEPGELKILTSFQMETDLCAMFELELVSHAIIIFGEPCLFATRRHLSYPILLPPRKETECVLTSPLMVHHKVKRFCWTWRSSALSIKCQPFNFHYDILRQRLKMQILHMENVTDKKFLLGSHLLVGLPPLLLVELGLPLVSSRLPAGVEVEHALPMILWWLLCPDICVDTLQQFVKLLWTLARRAPSVTWSQKSASEWPNDGRLAVVSPLAFVIIF